MKKVFVSNELTATLPTKCCCNIFKRINDLEEKLSIKKYLEKNLTDKFNGISSQGFEFEDNSIFLHHLYVDNEKVNQNGMHGVFRFKNSEANKKYQLYFGPIIDGTKLMGCFNMEGCKGIGCKGIGCKGGSGCKGNGCKSIGCSSKGGDDIQYLNFKNNTKNIEEVKDLNKYFGLRKEFNQENDDYIYETISGYSSLSELVKENSQLIIDAFKEEVQQIERTGYGFDKLLDMPSNDDLFTQAMLFSNSSSKQISIESSLDSSNLLKNLFLSRFDLWYFPRVKGLLRLIWEFILKILTLGFYHGNNSKTSFYTHIIEDNNIKQLEMIYEDDFNRQEVAIQHQKDIVGEYGGKVPVTIAIKHNYGFFQMIHDWLFGERYDFHTYLIDAMLN